jgi:hypothetical protein
MYEPQAMSRTAPAKTRASLRATVASMLVCAAGAIPFAADALPVLPQASGYGLDTPAGRGGQVHRVTNLNASGAGSLKACLDGSGPRVCVFEVSGTIRVTSDLSISNPNITIAGQTAPSPGIMIRGAALRISASDVLVQHIRVRPGDDSVGPEIRNRDALKIESPPERPIKNIVVDHCSFGWATDEQVALWNAWDNVTLSNNIIAEGLFWQPTEGHLSGYGLIVGPRDARVSIIGNLLAHNRERNPLSRGKQMAFVNNVVYNQRSTAVDLQSEDGRITNNTIIGNVFIRGADTLADFTSVNVRTGDELALPTASKIYVADNAAAEALPGNDWSVVTTRTAPVASSLKATLPTTWPTGLTRLPTSADVVLNEVLNHSGARPADRDPVDARVVKSVRDRTGRIITCVAPNGTERCSRNAGGWPTLAQNTRPLTLPANHSEVTSSGYTKLEVWLHEMSAQVEGRSPKLPAPPVLASDR